MAMFGKTSAPSKENKKQLTKGSSDKFEEMATEVALPDCSIPAFKHIMEIKAKMSKKLMGRKLTNESSHELMTQLALAEHVMITSDISNDSFFLSITKQMGYSLENPTSLCKQLRTSFSN